MRLCPALLFLCACGGSIPTTAPGKDVERCTDDGMELTCSYQELSLPTRMAYWQVPAGDPPAAGWPVAIVFHGSFVQTAPSWHDKVNEKWGGYRLGQTTKTLLEHGYAVVTPESLHDGNWFWNTNVVGFAENWSSAPDGQMMTELFDALFSGKIGPVDASHLYATGISSGGYMTSRMAVSYAGKFKALAVHSASYATCSSVLCSVPDLPADHPPTLLLHGEKDSVVPISTMRQYEQKLNDQGLVVETEVAAEAGHEWLEAAVERIPAFFDAHR